MPEFLPFALPDIGAEEIAEVMDSLNSGWLTTGPKAKRFEKEFSEFIGSGVEAVAVNSATSGLHLALDAVGVGPGDEVITTPYTFTATAEVIRYMGADAVFADIDPLTFNIDPAGIERALTKRTKAIIPVHLAGLACDMDAILKIAQGNGLKVIEDAAHALPAKYKGTLIGALDSDATVYSFYATKPVTTGEGGMVVTKDSRVASRCRVMRLHGINSDAFDRYRSTRPSWFYEVIAPGFKYNLSDIAASIGLHQLKKAHRLRGRRERMAGMYDEAFKGLPLLLPPKAGEGSAHAWHLYVTRIARDAGITRDRFIEEMAERGIGTSVHYIPLHMQPYWRDRYGLKPEDFPNATALYEMAVSLPLFTKMTEDDQQRVIRAVKGILS
jgi:dTDP-4-amino-4,6-dideoxygalactose transaminase